MSSDAAAPTGLRFAARLPGTGWLALGLGLAAGLLFGGDVISWLITLWRAHMLPAFMEINASGIPLCA